jgi:hypothetical protein
MNNPSQELHHGFYGKDIIGISIFPVCTRCHQMVCHSKENWIRDKTNPVWRNRNTASFLARLQTGYMLLYGGINHEK